MEVGEKQKKLKDITTIFLFEIVGTAILMIGV